jgi:acyl-CoA thioester hydrolase
MSHDKAHGRIQVRVYYEDTDASGIVYHANYLRFIERGRTELLRDLGLDHHSLLSAPDPIAYAVSKMTLSFERPARIDDLLVVETWVTAVTAARLMMSQKIFDQQDQLLFSAEVEVVCISPDGRPRRLPANARAGFSAVTLRHTKPVET